MNGKDHDKEKDNQKTYPPLSRKCIYAGTFLAVAVFIADQITKAAAVHLLKEAPPFVLIPGVLDFRYAENPGAAWGMLAGHSWILLAVACVTLVLALRYLNSIAEGSVCKAAAVFLAIGGIAGNAVDRVWHGYVIDFIAVDLQFYKWPIFNVADSAICIGAALYILFSLSGASKKGKVTDAPASDS